MKQYNDVINCPICNSEPIVELIMVTDGDARVAKCSNEKCANNKRFVPITHWNTKREAL